MKRYTKIVLAIICGLGVNASLWAQDNEDGPGRGVARISVVNGDVSVRRGDSGDYIAAALNAPLVVQDAVVTNRRSLAEIQFDYSNMLRLGSDAEVRLSELEYKRYQVQVARGTVMFRVLRDQEAEVEISTPNVSVRPVRSGSYRVTVLEDGTSEITVRSGEADVFTPQGSERLRAGRTMLARGSASDPEFQMIAAIREDEWDRWNSKRDRDLERSESYQYVSHDVFGAEDLDDHGHWANVPPYGMVWVPRVDSGWAPYRNGRWTWIDWYGWSWVSYDPWGWAPYHYGRWFYSAPAGWCWYPGGFGARHYWSPALVAFFGFGRSGLGVGFGGFGNVGWIPLGPNEPYHRWYGSRYYGGFRNSTHIDNSINIVNNVNITNVYRNARVVNGVTAIDGAGFGRGHVGSTVRVSEADFRQAGLVRGQLPVTPTRDSLRLSDREASVRGTAVPDRQFYSNRQPTRVDRVPFEQQQRGIEQASRRAFADAPARTAAAPGGVAPSTAGMEQGTRSAARMADETVRFGRRNSGASSVAASEPTRGADSGSQWRRFGSARTAEPSRTDAPAARTENVPRSDMIQRDAGRPESDNTGWRRFGEPAGGRSSDNSTPAYRSDTPRTAPADSGWRRQSDTGSAPRSMDVPSRRSDPSSVRQDYRGPSPRMESPAAQPSYTQDQPRFQPRNEMRSSGAEVRISPPIVRERAVERSAPRSEAPPASRGGGEGRSDGGAAARSAESGARGDGRGGRGR
jgi:hypothetical protein